MKKEKLCNFCQKTINLDKEKYVLLGTYNGKDMLDESYFHWNCFNKWYNSRVKQKAENVIKGATKKVAGILSGLKQFAGGGSSGEQVVDLGMDMKNEIPDMSEEMKWK